MGCENYFGSLFSLLPLTNNSKCGGFPLSGQTAPWDHCFMAFSIKIGGKRKFHEHNTASQVAFFIALDYEKRFEFAMKISGVIH